MISLDKSFKDKNRKPISRSRRATSVERPGGPCSGERRRRRKRGTRKVAEKGVPKGPNREITTSDRDKEFFLYNDIFILMTASKMAAHRLINAGGFLKMLIARPAFVFPRRGYLFFFHLHPPSPRRRRAAIIAV